MKFSTLSTMYVTENGQTEARSPKAQQRLRNAYIAFKDGRPSVEDCQLIWVDLAKFSGYYNTTPPEVSDAVLRYCEGQRSIFGRIMIMSDPAASILDSLQRAVQEEMRTDVETGYEIT